MSDKKNPLYCRGRYHIDLVRGKGGAALSDRWYIYWYDKEARRQRRKSTGTRDFRLACQQLDERYLAERAETGADGQYCLHDTFSDYVVEHSSKLDSGAGIKSRLKFFLRFVEEEIAQGVLLDPVLPSDIHEGVLDRFRIWASEQPIILGHGRKGARNLKPVVRQRSAATSEDIIRQCKTAINYAYDRQRISGRPEFRARRTRYIRAVNHDRISVSQMGEMLDFCVHGGADHASQLWQYHALRRYLVAAICTLARPSSIFDMNVDPARGQWLKADRLFDLNPAGRLQNNKRRAVIPLHPVLEDWLGHTQQWFICIEQHWRRVPGSTKFGQRRVQTCNGSWRTVSRHIDLPENFPLRLLRHSMASELRRRGVNPWELAGYMGHSLLNMTEIYAIYDPAYLSTVAAGIDDIISDLCKMPGCAEALSPSYRPVNEADEAFYIAALPGPDHPSERMNFPPAPILVKPGLEPPLLLNLGRRQDGLIKARLP
jgi:integrase